VPQLIEANARVGGKQRTRALQRGPLVYCLEQIDQPEGTSLQNVSLRRASSNSGKDSSESFEKDCWAACVWGAKVRSAQVLPRGGRSIFGGCTREFVIQGGMKFIPITRGEPAATPMQVGRRYRGVETGMLPSGCDANRVELSSEEGTIYRAPTFVRRALFSHSNRAFLPAGS